MRKLHKLLYTLPLCLMVFISSGCQKKDSIESICIKDDYEKDVLIGCFNPSDYEIVVKTVNGEEKTIPVTEDMIAQSEKSKYYNVGTQEIIVNYMDEELKIVVNIKRHDSFDVSFDVVDSSADVQVSDDQEGFYITYDGKPHSLDVIGYYPKGTEIYYPYGNTFTEVGKHYVEARLSHYNYEPMVLTGYICITRSTYDLDLKFEDLNTPYDGESHSISLVGDIPEEVTVSYTIKDKKNVEQDGNSAIDAGTYLVTASFSSTNLNYYEISPVTATLTIEKATYDTDVLSIGEQNAKYTGSDIEWVLTNNLPNWITAEYVNYISIDSEKVIETDAGYYVKTKKGEGDFKLNEKDEFIPSANGEYVYAGKTLYNEDEFGNFYENEKGNFVKAILTYYAQSEKGYHKVFIKLTVNNDNYNEILDYKEFEIFIYEG